MTDDSIQQMYILHRISKCHSRKEKRKYDEYDKGGDDDDGAGGVSSNRRGGSKIWWWVGF